MQLLEGVGSFRTTQASALQSKIDQPNRVSPAAHLLWPKLSGQQAALSCLPRHVLEDVGGGDAERKGDDGLQERLVCLEVQLACRRAQVLCSANCRTIFQMQQSTQVCLPPQLRTA